MHHIVHINIIQIAQYSASVCTVFVISKPSIGKEESLVTEFDVFIESSLVLFDKKIVNNFGRCNIFADTSGNFFLNNFTTYPLDIAIKNKTNVENKIT